VYKIHEGLQPRRCHGIVVNSRKVKEKKNLYVKMYHLSRFPSSYRYLPKIHIYRKFLHGCLTSLGGRINFHSFWPLIEPKWVICIKLMQYSIRVKVLQHLRVKVLQHLRVKVLQHLMKSFHSIGSTPMFWWW
jgi:hypothetical protein